MKYLIFTLATATFLISCSDDSSSNKVGSGNEVELRNMTLAMKAVVGDEEYTCGTTYAGVGAEMSDYQVNDVRMFISNVTASMSDGGSTAVTLEEDGVWQHDGIALIDFGFGCDVNNDPTTNTSLKGDIQIKANESVTSICFDLGVPFNRNHENSSLSAPPLNVSGMFWVWRIGHKFLRIDGVGNPATDATGFNVHLGSTGCITEGDAANQMPTEACRFPNVSNICMDIDPESQAIAFDLKALLAQVDVSKNTENTPPGCMSANNDPECQVIMPGLGLDFTFIPGDSEMIFAKDEAWTATVFKAIDL